jgi:hypothetical protein
MRTTAVSTAAVLMALLVAGGLAFGQTAAGNNKPPKPEAPKAEKSGPQSLDDLLAEALKNNPDIRVAEANLLAAQAELNRTRLKVTHRIVALRAEMAGAKALVEVYERELQRLHSLRAKRLDLVSDSELQIAKQQMIKFKAELARLEAELPYLLGKQSSKKDDKALVNKDDKALARRLQYLLYLRSVEQAQRLWDDQEIIRDPTSNKWLIGQRKLPRGTIADKLRKALDRPVTLKVEKSPLGEVLEHLQDKVQGISFHVVDGKQGHIKNHPVSVDLKEVPLGAAIQAIQDTIPNLRFVVRDYGVLVTWQEQLPPRALLLEDFWKGDKGEESATKKNPPKEDIQGIITKVNSSGLVSLNIGSDAGLRQGQTLEVFRLKPNPTYLGTLRIEGVKKETAVGKLISRRGKELQIGDLVASKVLSR